MDKLGQESDQKARLVKIENAPEIRLDDAPLDKAQLKLTSSRSFHNPG